MDFEVAANRKTDMTEKIFSLLNFAKLPLKFLLGFLDVFSLNVNEITEEYFFRKRETLFNSLANNYPQISRFSESTV